MALQRAEWITITTIILTGFVTAAISLGGIYYSNIKSKETLKLEIDSQKDLLEENFKKQREEANHQIKIKEKTVAFYKAMNVMDAHLSQQCWGGFPDKKKRLTETTIIDIKDARSSLNDLFMYDENGKLIEYYLDVITNTNLSNPTEPYLKFKIEARKQIGLVSLENLENSIDRSRLFIPNVGIYKEKYCGEDK